jgi:hypothetical protein
LCEECDLPASGRGSRFVDESGLTCNMLLLEMADTDNESSAESSVCKSLQNSFRRSCCDSTYQPPEVAQAPTPTPQINLTRGNQPLCDLCEDGSFPGLPRTVTAVLYIDGNPTCELLYYMGLYGLIEDRLCSPMQDYLEEGCGCGIYDPDYTTNLPLPSPTKIPTSSPTVEPTIHPTQKPTLTPSHLPTSTPSTFQPTSPKPTAPPTMAPVVASSPMLEPTVYPTPHKPTLKPTRTPTSAPSTFKPTPSKSTVPPTMAPVLDATNGPPKGTTVPSLVLPATIVLKRSSSSQSSKDDDAYKMGKGRVRGGKRG